MRGEPVSKKTEKALKAALRLLRFRPRSSWELFTRLRQIFDEETCRVVIQELQSKTLVDDHAFSKFWIENRIQFRPVAKNVLFRELLAKRVDRKTIEGALEGAFPEGERAVAERCLASRAKRADPKDPKSYGKLYGFLRRRGFSHEIVTELLEEYAPAHDDGQ